MKIVINRCYGGFSLSHKAFLKLREMGNKYALEEPDIGECYSDGSIVRSSFMDVWLYEIPRDNKDLIKVVEEMGSDVNGSCAKLEIVEIPDDVEWEIEEYDGLEWVSEKHRRWG